MDEQEQRAERELPKEQGAASSEGQTVQAPQRQLSERPEEMREACPYALCDVAAAETWLEDRAREGWQLQKTKGWRAVFVKVEPRECRYRLQPLARKKEAISSERREVYGSLGWQYVTVMQGIFHVWRSEDPDAPEIDTDPVVQAEGYRYLKRKMILAAAVELCFLMVLGAMMLWWWVASSTPLLYALGELPPGRMLAGQVWLLLTVALEVRELLGMRRLLRTLTAGVPLSRPRPYRLQQWLQRIAVALAFLILVIMPLVEMRYGYNDHFHGWNAWDRSETPRPEVVYWELRETEDLIAEPVYWEVETKVHELASRMYYVREYGDLEGGFLAVAITTYYHMRTEGLGKRLADELREEFATWSGWETLAQVPSAQLDAFWWSREAGPDTGPYGDSLQYAVARKGGQVVAVEYKGRTDLRTQETYLLNLLEK